MTRTSVRVFTPTTKVTKTRARQLAGAVSRVIFKTEGRKTLVVDHDDSAHVYRIAQLPHYDFSKQIFCAKVRTNSGERVVILAKTGKDGHIIWKFSKTGNSERLLPKGMRT